MATITKPPITKRQSRSFEQRCEQCHCSMIAHRKNARYCSRRCAQRAQRSQRQVDRPIEQLIKTVCAGCDREMIAKRRSKRVCSRACWVVVQKRRSAELLAKYPAEAEAAAKPQLKLSVSLVCQRCDEFMPGEDRRRRLCDECRAKRKEEVWEKWETASLEKWQAEVIKWTDREAEAFLVGFQRGARGRAGPRRNRSSRSDVS